MTAADLGVHLVDSVPPAAAAAANLSAAPASSTTGAAPTPPPQVFPDDPWHRTRAEVMAQSTRILESSALAAEAGKDDDELKPIHPKDVKPPAEFGGARKYFLPWHELFTSMLRLRSTRWTKIVDWLKARREKRLYDDKAKAEFMTHQAHDPDPYIDKHFELFSKHLYGYLLDNTKDQVRIEVLANKEAGVF